MLLERFKQGYMGIKRKYGVHGVVRLDHPSVGSKTIYTLESPWNTNKDEPNGILGLSCVAPGAYQLSVEKSPVNSKEYPFLINPSLNVCLRAKVKSFDKTGHCFVDHENFNPEEIYGRFILCGTSYKYNSKGYYSPIESDSAVAILNKYIRESGDNQLSIRWRN